MKNEVNIEIIFSTYNGEKFLKDQIESILNQTYKKFTLIIRDDGSTDQTKEILNYYASIDKRIKIINDNNGNLGLLKSMELLLKKTKTDLVFFADQDDYWFENKINIFLEKYYFSTEPILIHSNCYVTDNNLNVKKKFLGNTPKNLGIENSLFRYFVQGASTMINGSLRDNLLPFRDNAYIHDRYAHLMCEITGKRIYIDECTMYYRQHENNQIGSSSLIEKIQNNLRLQKFYHIKDKNLIEELSKEFNNNLLKLYCEITDDDKNRFYKIYLKFRFKINMRLKEIILLILKN